MKILTIIYEFPPVGGGGGRAAYDICKGLAARGHDVTVLTAHWGNLPRAEMLDDVNVIRVPSFRKDAFAAPFHVMLAYVIFGFLRGLPLIWRARPDLMHAHFAVPSGALAWLLSACSGVPYILTAHLGDVPGGVPEKTGKWFRWLLPFTHPIWKRARKVIAVSEHTRALALRHYAVPIEVIHNGAEMKALSERHLSPHAPPRLVFAGRFAPQKNPLMIVDVLAKLQDLNWTCAMLGDGVFYEQVKNEIAARGMAERFSLPGWVTPQQVLAEFSRSDILFMPSLSEGLPVVGVQALANGLALVVSHIGGFLDLVDENQNGYMLDAQDSAAFADALRRLLTSPELLQKFRAASWKKAESFNVEKIVAAYQSIFRSVIHEP